MFPLKKKRGQEAMKVGIEFWSTSRSQTRLSSMIKSRLHPYHTHGTIDFE
jgi:hypothetical protein